MHFMACAVIVGVLAVFLWLRHAEGVKLVIHTAPAQTRVLVDDRPAGVSGDDGQLVLTRVRRGHLNLRAQAEGYEEWTSAIDLGPADITRSVDVILVRPGVSPITSSALILQPSGEPGPSLALAGKPGAELGGGDLVVFYRDLGREVMLTMRSAGLPILHADVNGNGVVDAAIDATYAVYPDGRSCVQYLRAPGAPAECGAYKSRAVTRIQRADGVWEVTWTIPKIELTRLANESKVSFQVFDEASQASRYYPGPPFASEFRLQLPGVAVTPPAPAPRENSKAEAHPARPSRVERETPRATHEAPVAAPPTITFSADRTEIDSGQPVVLTWQATAVESIEITPDVGKVKAIGQVVVRPLHSATYTLTGIGHMGESAQRLVVISVREPVELISFTSDRAAVQLRGEFVLSWNTRHAESVTLDLVSKPADSATVLQALHVQPEGRLAIPVKASEFTRYGGYEYRITARGLYGPKEARVRIDVQP